MHRNTGLGCKQHQLAALTEPRAALFDLVKPSKRAIDCGVDAGFAAGVDDLNSHERPHRDLSADGQSRSLLRCSLRFTQGLDDGPVEGVGALGGA